MVNKLQKINSHIRCNYFRVNSWNS